MAEFNLQRLLDPVTAEQFIDEYWEQRPLVITKRTSDYYAELLSMAGVDHIISTMNLRYPSLRLFKDGAAVPMEEFTSNIPWGDGVFSGVVNVEKVLQKYQQGATIILQALHMCWPPLALLCQNLEKLFNQKVQTNIYMTRQSFQGLTAHSDSHDVFVLQIAGKKHWRIYGAPTPLPLLNQPLKSAAPTPDDLLYDFVLEPGDMVYIPRGFIHEAIATDGSSLHITVGLVAYTWVDVFQKAFKTIWYRNPKFRKSLPVGFAKRKDIAQSLEAEFDELARELTAEMQEVKAINEIADSFIASRRAMLEAHLISFDQLETLNLDTVVYTRPGMIFKLTVDDDAATLLFHGKKVVFPPYVEPCLHFISETESFSVANIPGELDDSGKLVLARRLIKEGFLFCQ